MFKVFVNDGTEEMPTDDIFYIVSKEGIFLKKTMGIMDSIAPVKNISILESVSTMARMNIPKLPAVSVAKVIEFFKAVYKEHYGEAIVLLFYNEATKKFKFVPPHQKVTAASLDYNRGITIEGWTMIGDIHSHAGMSAFHSGVDDGDEKTFDGLHITFGHMRDDDISISASIVANGHRFMVEPVDYISGIKLTRDIDETETKYTTKVYKWIDGKLQIDTKASSKNAYSYRKFDKRYVSTVTPSKRQFNPAWMNNVEKGAYSYTYNAYGVGGYVGGSRRGGRWGSPGWGPNYDPHAWNEKYHKVGIKPQVGTSPLIPYNSGVVTFPPHDVKDDKLPCLTCVHKALMLENIDELIAEEEEDKVYQCSKCKLVIGGDSEEIICTNCKTDKHLVELIIEGVDDEDVADINRAADIDIDDQPDQIGFHVCDQCGTTFLLLKTDEKCPQCETLLPENPEIIDKNAYDQNIYDREEATAHQMLADAGSFISEEAYEANIQAIKDASNEDTYMEGCNQCGSQFVKCSCDTHCPFCKAPLPADSYGQTLLEAAAEEDQVLEMIPDPSKSEIPLPREKTKTVPTWKQMLASCFGKGKIGSS